MDPHSKTPPSSSPLSKFPASPNPLSALPPFNVAPAFPQSDRSPRNSILDDDDDDDDDGPPPSLLLDNQGSDFPLLSFQEDQTATAPDPTQFADTRAGPLSGPLAGPVSRPTPPPPPSFQGQAGILFPQYDSASRPPFGPSAGLSMSPPSRDSGAYTHFGPLMGPVESEVPLGAVDPRQSFGQPVGILSRGAAGSHAIPQTSGGPPPARISIVVPQSDPSAVPHPSAPYRFSNVVTHHYSDEDDEDDDRSDNYDDDDDSDSGEASQSLMIEMDPVRPRAIRSGLEARGERPSPMYRSLLGSHLRKTAKLLRRGLGLPYPRPRARRGAHGDGGAPTSPSAASTQHPRVTRATLEARERAYRIWVEVRDLDQFLSRVYYHYTGKGVYAIILARFTNLFILAFIVVFSTFLFYCIDYPLIHDKKYLYEVVHQNCVSRIHGIPYTTMIIFIIWWVYQMARLIMDIPKLFEVNAFYVDLLGIGNSELQTIKWRDVVARILEINNTSADTRHGNLDSYIIANRIMRYDNYMIALFNKDLLDLKVPFLPFFGSRMFLTKIIEWNLQFCIFYYIFDEKGRMRKHFLKDRNREALINGLRQRFITMGIINLVVSPFLVILLVMYFFFRYAEEFQKNPGKISARQYTPEAAWRFREFNELPHLLQERMNRSYENAVKYLEQFPKEWMIILARFVSFIAGSFAAVLTVITLVDQDILLGFELHPGGSVLFYIGIFGSILAVSRGMVPAEYTLFEPERLIRTVANDTHYLPPEWKKRLHTEEVKTEFSSLFDIKVATFLKEILSIFLVPLIFCFSLPKSCEAIIDFFRNFTVHEESLGHVCSFAVFDFKKHGNSMYGAPTGTQDDYFMSKGGKMEQSFLNFKLHNPDWEPNNMEGSMYLSNIMSRTADSRLMFFPTDKLDAGKRAALDESRLNPNAASGSGRSDGPADSTLRMRYGAESQLGASELLDNGHVPQLTDGLFALLDAIYENNRTVY